MSVRTYSLSTEGMRQEKRKAILRGTVTALLGLSVGLGVPTLAGLVPYWLPLALVPVLLIAFGVGARRGFKILQDRWLSLQFLFDPDFIVKRQLGFPDVEISRDEVREILEKPSGIFVLTGEKQRYIQIPKGVEGYDELKTELGRWRDIESGSEKSLAIYFPLLLFVVSFAVVFLSRRVWLISAAGVFVVAYTLWSQINFNRNPQVDSRIKTNVWRIVSLVLVMVVIVVSRIYAVLSSQ